MNQETLQAIKEVNDVLSDIYYKCGREDEGTYITISDGHPYLKPLVYFGNHWNTVLDLNNEVYYNYEEDRELTKEEWIDEIYKQLSVIISPLVEVKKKIDERSNT